MNLMPLVAQTLDRVEHVSNEIRNGNNTLVRMSAGLFVADES